jgi:hypothetical protein
MLMMKLVKCSFDKGKMTFFNFRFSLSSFGKVVSVNGIGYTARKFVLWAVNKHEAKAQPSEDDRSIEKNLSKTD